MFNISFVLRFSRTKFLVVDDRSYQQRGPKLPNGQFYSCLLSYSSDIPWPNQLKLLKLEQKRATPCFEGLADEGSGEWNNDFLVRQV